MHLPLIGRRLILLEVINSIDSTWHVERWVEHYYFLRMEVFSRKIEKLVRNKEAPTKTKSG